MGLSGECGTHGEPDEDREGDGGTAKPCDQFAHPQHFMTIWQVEMAWTQQGCGNAEPASRPTR